MKITNPPTRTQALWIIGVKWHVWRDHGVKIDTYLRGADLRGVNLDTAYLDDANLVDADLRGTYLRGAHLCRANLRNATLDGANLRNAYLENAILEGANLRNSTLEGVYLEGANLEMADLRGTYLRDTNFDGTNLRDARLDGVTMNWQSHALIGERLRQAAGDDYHKLALASAAAHNPQHWWDWWCENVPAPEKAWALEEMRAWVKDGDAAPEFLLA